MTIPVLPIPPNGTPYIDPATGQVALIWQNYFLSLSSAVATGFAPVDGTYLVARSNSELTDEVNLGGMTSGWLKIAVAAATATVSSHSTIPVTDLTGTLPISKGGTGQNTSPTDGQVLIGKTSDSSLNLATLTQGSGITITNGAGAITIAASSPSAIGAWTDYSATSTIHGWGAYTAGRKQIWYADGGTTVFVIFHIEGTSNDTIVDFTLPFSCKSINAAFSRSGALGFAQDNTVTLTAPGRFTLDNNSALVTCYANSGTGAWTNSGTKIVEGLFSYDKA